ncbi:histidine kinase [Bacillus sp. FJAT-27231]|uniref:sensor domain-containing diguanylate cyclase n=1 Tax=Bacillus sp. FJAT-27231 TaxID=1679168 RepID=UPI000671505D|nr:sensor domain-containing diguanylate cyclase [Bacillus sp. FJAT-27231]KMY54220.1 histidine kinase [Bacillus sp. FJAT-27231]
MYSAFASGFATAALLVILSIPFLYKKWQKERARFIEKHNQFVNVVENSKDFIYYYQVYPERQYKYLSPSAENIFGKGSIAYAYVNPDVCFRDIHPDDYDTLYKKITGQVDYSEAIIQRWKDKDGKYRWFEEYATPVYENGVLVAIQGVLRTIDDKVELQEKLNYRLYHDTLTDSYNREYFELVFSKFNEEINSPIAIILCDLDELKHTNDHYGHIIGDLLIKTTARILNKFSSDYITVARLGGDEFVLIVADRTEKQIKQLIANIVKAIEHYNTYSSDVIIKMSIGYSYSPFSIEQMMRLFSQADKNMYADKIKRKNEFAESL